MDRLRTPFLILAIVLSFLLVLLETGSALPGVLQSHLLPVAAYQLPPALSTTVAGLSGDQRQAMSQLGSQGSLPGQSVPDLALLDSILLFTVALMGLAVVLPEGLQGKVQGIATLIFSLLLIGFAIRQLFIALSLLLLMLALLEAIPFGTILYLIIYGTFNRAGTDLALSITMLLKFGFAGSLFLAQQRFLQSKGLVALLFTSLLGTVLVSFLLGLVPGFLVSLTDAIAAIIVSVIAIIWGVILLIGSLTSILKLLQPEPVLAA